MGATMSRKQIKHLASLKESAKELPKPRVTSFVARECTACVAVRASDPDAAGQNYSRVYAKVGSTRYCKCSYCGHTWKQTD